MRFMMLILPKGYDQAPTGAVPDAKAVKNRLHLDIHASGARRLHPPAAGVRIQFAGGKATAVDGPFPEAKEVVGGYWLIQVKSKEEAVEWAKRCPAGDGNVIEVRQVQELSEFPADLQEAARF